MEDPSCDVYKNQVPYRATRTFSDTDTPESLERRFEPTWARKCYSSGFAPNISSTTITPSTYIYTRDNIANVIYSLPTDTPPSQCLLSCDLIFLDNSAASIQILNKSYCTADSNDYTLPWTNSKEFEVRGLSGRGRGKGVDYVGSWAGAVNSEFDGKRFSSRGPIWRSKFAGEFSTSQPRRRVLSECGYSETPSEGMSESPRDAGADWQYFPDDETFEQDYYPIREPQLERENIGEICTQKHKLDRKELSWHDTSSFIKTKNRLEMDTNQVPTTTSSHKDDIPQLSKRLEPNSFSFLNPSDVDATSITSNTNQSNSISTFSDEDLKHSQDYFNELEITQKLKPQDPEHLWYYIDPKGSIQGPFLSEQMDDWYGRNFFPQTLPIWRECDSKPFKLANLLNITEMSNEPFSVGAGRLLVSREYHPVKDIETRDLSTNMTQPLNENNEIFHDKPMESKIGPEKVLISNSPSSDEVTVLGHEFAKEDEMIQFRNDEFTKNSNDNTSEAQLAISDLSYPTEESSPVTCGQEIQIDSTSDSKISPIFIHSEKDMPQLETKNMWLSGPPTVPERKNKVKDTSFPVTTTSLHKFTIDKPENPGLIAPEQPPRNTRGTKKLESNNEKPTQPRSPINPLIEDSSSWKKVGLSKKQKTKTKASQFESNNLTRSLLQFDEITVPSDSNRGSKTSTQRPKLDELDSFGINRQRVKLLTPSDLPKPQNEAPVVNFNLILTEQTKEEKEYNVNTKKKSMLLTQKQENLTLTKNKTWNSSPIDTTPLSFLAIESEQKKTIKGDLPRGESIQIDEAQTTDQPVCPSTWARITKSKTEGGGKITSDTKTSISLRVDESVKSPKIEEIPIAKQTAEPQMARIVPGGILLSPDCYEWSCKEILFLNNHVDPPTVISFLQEFNGVFEMTQLASEMLGSSARTNSLCKRICEDLTGLKKLRQNKSASVDENWVKVSKKPVKTAKKKGKPSKSFQN